MINTINDGEPITYELLNQIIEQVNSINSSDLNDVTQIVQVIGRGIQTTEDAKAIIAVGSANISVPASDTKATATINFQGSESAALFTAIPYVTATIVDVNTSQSGGGLNGGSVTVTQLSKTSMDVRVDLIRKVNRAVTIRVNYMAIGPGSNA